MPSQQSQSTSSSSNKQNSTTAGDKYKPPTRYTIIRDGWGGSRPAFQHSYGLRMDPDDIEEGNQILDAMIEGDKELNEK